METGKSNKFCLHWLKPEELLIPKTKNSIFVEAYILSSPKNIYDAIESGAVVMDLCIDQPASDFRKRAPHDRGPHIRIPLRKLTSLFENVEKIM